jgi:toxin ParE1/3/4
LIAEGKFWTVRLSPAAAADFRSIVDWTFEQFGERQARIYKDTLAAALDALTDGPTTIGVKERSEIAKGLFTLHVARGSRRGRHFVLFRVANRGRTQTIEVPRLLRVAMDVERRISDTRNR